MDKDWLELGETAVKNGNLKQAVQWFTRAAETGNFEAMIHLAYLAYGDGKNQEARQWLGQITKNPDLGNNKVLEHLNDAAICARRNGDDEECIRICRITAGQGILAGYMNLAYSLRERKEYQEAEYWYAKAVQAGELNAYCQLGLNADWSGDPAAATKWFEKGAAAGDSACMRMLGGAAREAGDLETARQYFTQAAAHGSVRARRDLGYMAWEAGDIPGAQEWFRKAIYDSGCGTPVDAESFLALGNLALEQGDVDEAMMHWEDAAQAGSTDAIVNIGCELYDAGNRKRAKELFLMAAKRGNVEAKFQLGYLLHAENKYDDATHWYEQAAHEGHRGALNEMGMRAMRVGDEDLAKQLWEAAAQRGQHNSMWHLGVCAEQAGDMELARTWYEKALAALTDPELAVSYTRDLIRVGGSAAAGGGPDAAPSGKILTDASATGSSVTGASATDDGATDDGATGSGETDYTESDAWVARAEKAYNEGNPARAEQWLLKAAEADNPSAMIRLSALADLAGDQVKSRMWWGRAAGTVSRSGDPKKLYEVGCYLRDIGQLQFAFQCLEQAAAAGQVPAMVDLGALLANHGPAEQLDEAVTWFQKAAEQGHPTAMTNLGVIAERRGQKDLAKNWYKQAVIEKNDRAAALNLAELLQGEGDFEKARNLYHLAALLQYSNDEQFREALWHSPYLSFYSADEARGRQFPEELGSASGTFPPELGQRGLRVPGGWVAFEAFDTIESWLENAVDAVREAQQAHDLPELRDAELALAEMLDAGAPFSADRFKQVANMINRAVGNPYFKRPAQPMPLPEPEQAVHQLRMGLWYARDNLKKLAAIPGLVELRPSERKVFVSFYPLAAEYFEQGAA